MSVSSVSGRINAIKEIHAALNSLQYIGGSSNSHQIGRFLFREERYNLLDNMIHLLMGLTDCQATDSIAVQIQFTDPFSMFDADIIKNRTLIDSKQKLMRIDRILQTV